MKCLDCGKTQFIEKKETFNVDFKGENVTVKSAADVCKNCGFRITDNRQMNELRKAVADKYKENKGLLTSEDIKAYRKKLDMSQTEFAEYLKVGEASIKRWETYFVQDESQNDHIRLKCDKDYSELISLLIQEPSIYTGWKRFDLNYMQNIVLALIPVYKSPLFINKALFYTDFLHYKKHGIGITGSVYSSLPMGPCPDKYSTIYKIMSTQGYIADDKGTELLQSIDTNWDIFEDSHKEVIEQIIEIGNKHGKEFIYKLSHKEKAYKRNPSPSIEISYKDAKNLKITKHL